MKVAVSIPDEVFEDAERLARQLGTTRSDVYRRALEEYVGRHAAPSVTQALDRVLEEVGVYEADEFTRRASRRALGRSDW